MRPYAFADGRSFASACRTASATAASSGRGCDPPAECAAARHAALPSRLGSSPRALLTDLEYRGQPIRHFAQIERLPNHDALVPLEPDAHFVCLGVTRHDRDTAFIAWPTMHDGEIEGEPPHRRQVNVEQQPVRLLVSQQLVPLLVLAR